MSPSAYLLSLRAALRDATSHGATADALADLAFAEMRVGRSAEAALHLDSLASLAEAEPAAHLDALVHYMRGVFDFYAGRTTAAVTNLLHARRHARNAKSEKLEARSLAVLCGSLARMGAQGDAFEYGTNALEHAIRIGDDRARVIAHISLANLYNDREDGRAALKEIDAAGDAMQRLNDPITRTSLHSSRVAALLLNARELMANPVDESQKLVQQTIDACRAAARAADESGHLKARVFCWGNLADLYMLANQSMDALATIDLCIQLCKQENASDSLASALHAKGSFLAQLGRHDEAIALLEQARDYALQSDYLGVQSLIEADRVTCYEKLGNLKMALEAAKAHARCLSLQRSAERASLDSLAAIKREFAGAQREVVVARARADELTRSQERLIEDTQRLKQISFEDALTQLKNRRYFDFRFPDLLEQQADATAPLSMAIIDIDHFKEINDRAGHLAGDDVLREVARVLQSHCGVHDEVCRLGGDEFVLLLPGVTIDAAHVICDHARTGLANSAIGHAHRVTLSIGVAQWTPGETSVAFLTRTDEKLFQAKREGRNRVAK
jgi:diguanylate cyclase (GGDEF)-like protein